MRRKLLLLVIAITASSFAFGQLTEGFETWPPADWTIVQGACSPTNDITQSSTYANSGTYSARFSSFSTCGSGYDEYLITPELIVTSGDQTISFWYHGYTSGSEVFKVGWSATGTDVSTDFTWGPEVSDASTTWQQYSKTDLPVGTKYVAIHYYSSYQYYLYIDDVAGPAYVLPACPDPTALGETNITTTSADLGWTAGGSETTWNIEWGLDGFTQGSGTLITGTTTNPHSLSGLTQDTDYDWYVQADCGGGDESGWVGPSSFSTLISCPVPTTLTESNITTSSVDLGWTAGGTETTWNIEWGLDGFTQGSGTMITGTTTNPHSLSGLSAATDYDWYIQADCGGGDESTWAMSSFTTACDTYTPDYLEDFTTFLPTCWDENTGPVTGPTGTPGSSAWAADGFANNGTTGSARINLYTTTRQEWLITPNFDLTGGGFELNFDVAVTAFSGTGSSNMGTDDEVQLLVTTDGGTTWTNLMTWNTANTPSNTGDNETVDISTLTQNPVQFAFWAADGPVDDTEDYNFYVDNFQVRTPPSCLAPTDLAHTNETTSGADVSWTSVDSFFDVYFVAAGDPAPDAGTTPTVDDHNSTTLTWAGGSADTDYDWYVRTDCDQDNTNVSTWSGPDNFRTLQIPAPVQTLPFIEDWETGAIGAAWNYHTGADGTIEVNTASVLNGTYGLEQYGDNSTGYSTPTDLADAYTKALPGGANENWTTWDQFSVDLTSASSPWLIFWYAMGYNFNDGYNNFWVQVSTDGSTWTDLLAMQTNGSNIPYEKKEYDLSTYNGTSQVYVRFFHNSKYPENYLRLDDIEVKEVSCAAPTAPTATNVTDDSADLGWTDGGTETMWNIEYGLAGFMQGSGTMVTGTTSNPTNISGLSEFTAYDWYVQADCGGGSTSSWVGPNSFVTECPSCCEHSVELVDSYGDGWNGGSLDVFVDGALVLDDITLATGSGPEAHAFDALTGSDIDVYYTAGSYGYENEYTVYDGGGTMLGESGQGGVEPTDLLDLTGDCPSCPPPTDLYVTNKTTTSADLGWIAGGSETAWNIEWGETGFTQGSGTLVSLVGNPYNLTGLTVTTTYDWYVQSDCDGTTRDESTWVGPNTFTTSANAVTSFPWAEGFENGGSIPLGWSYEYASGTHDWVYQDGSDGGDPTAAHSGSYNAAFIHESDGDITKLLTLPLDLSGLTSPYLTFWHAQNEWFSDQDELRVYYSNDGGATWIMIPGAEWTGDIPDWTKETFALPSPSGDYYIAFEGTDGFGYGVVVDDVRVLEGGPATATWSGGTSGDWHTAANWSGSEVPGPVTDVTIPTTGVTSFLEITAEADCNNFTVQSDASGNGQVLGDEFLTVNGTSTVQRHITGGVWHDLSASTQGQTVNSLYMGGSPDVWLRRYNEPTNDRTYITELTDPLPPGAGFEVWVEAGPRFDITVNYTGALQTTDVTLNTSSTPALSYSNPEPFGYNLIGNPFASPIDLDEGTWSLTDVSTSFWVWSGTWLAWNTSGGGSGTLGNGIVPMGQGFFIQATGAAPSITIPMDARVHSGQPYYKNTEEEGTLPQLLLNVSIAESYDKLNITFHKEASEVFDMFDTRKLFAYAGDPPQIYSEQSGEQLTINGLPFSLLEKGTSVKVGFIVGENGDHTIETDLSKLDDTEVWLEDLSTGHLQSLNDEPKYEFKANTEDEPERFILHFNSAITGIEDPEGKDLINVYAFDDKLCIKSTGDAAKEDKEVWIYDMFGRTAIQTEIAASSFTTIPVHQLKGYVVVKIISESGVKTNKVYIK